MGSVDAGVPASATATLVGVAVDESVDGSVVMAVDPDAVSVEVEETSSAMARKPVRTSVGTLKGLLGHDGGLDVGWLV